MTRPLSAGAVLLACGAAFAAAEPAPAPEPAPKTWLQAACDDSGHGLLLRASGSDAQADLAAATQDDAGFEPVAAGEAPGESGGGAKKSAPKPRPAPRSRTAPSAQAYRVAPGEGCQQRLSRLRGARGKEGRGLADEVDVTAAPDEAPKTAEELDAAFKGAGTLAKLSRLSFKTPGDLGKLFDKAQKLGSFEDAGKLAREDGGAFDAGDAAGGAAGGAPAVLAQTAPKPDPAGTGYDKPDQLAKLKQAAPPPRVFEPERDEAEPPRAYSSWAPVRAAQRAYDWSAEAAANIADRAHFTYDELRGNAPVAQAGPLTVVGGWARLPSLGPGFTFVGRGQYGTPTLVAGLMAAAADPIADVGAPMRIVAISKYGGGYFPPHKTHQNGIDVDVALAGFRNGPLDARALDRNLLFAVSVVEHMKPTYILLDQRRQFELQRRAEALMSRPDVDAGLKARIKAAYTLLFVRTPPPRGRRLFSHVENHYDHFHIREQAGELGR